MKLLKDESGQTVAVAAVFMGLIAIGFLAFALDVGTLFNQKRMAQGAADAVAIAAAEEVGYGNPGNKQAVANAVAKLNGFDTTLATNPATVTLTTPVSGNFTGSYVQATVSRPVSTLFLGAFSRRFATVPVSATAIAGGGLNPQTCVCIAGDLNLSGNSHLNANQCGIIDNSPNSNAIQISGSGSIDNALSVGSISTGWYPGNVSNGGSISPSTTIVQGITTPCQAPALLAPSYTAATCLTDPGGSFGTFVFGPASASGTACYKSLTVGANNSTCTLNPGTYVITTGQLHFESGANGKSNLGGNGVFIYLTGSASLVIDNGANVNLVAGNTAQSSGGTAPDLGTSYNGTVIYQDANDTSAITLQGGSGAYINGATVAFSAPVSIGNGSKASLNGGIVASSLTMGGGTALNVTAVPGGGSLAIVYPNPKLVQ